MRIRVFIFVVLVAILITSPFIIGSHHDGNGFLWVLIFGESGNYMADFNRFNDFNFIDRLIEFGVMLNYNFPWYALVAFAISLFASLGLLFILYQLIRIHFQLWFGTAVMLFCGFVLWGSLTFVHYNRAAFLISFLSILSILSLQLYPLTVVHSRMLLIVSWLLFLLGICLRAEAAVVVLIMAIPLIGLVWYKKTKRVLASVVPVFFVVIAFWGYYLYTISTSTEFYYNIEPEIEYEIMDRKNVVPLAQMLNGADSVRYLAATSWFLGDVEQVTPKFMRGIIQKPKDITHKYFFFSTTNFFSRFNPQILWQLKYYWWWLLLLLLLPLYLFLAGANKTYVAVLMAFYAIGGVLLFQSLTISALPRVVEPVLAVLATGGAWVGLQAKTPHAQRGIAKILAGVLLLLSICIGVNVFCHQQKLAARATAAEQKLNRIAHDFLFNHNRKYVLLTGDWSIVNTGFWKQYEGFKNKTLLLFEAGQFSANPAFLSTNARLTGCPPTDFKCRIQFADTHKNETIFIATEKRLKLYETYMQAVYGVQLNWSSAPRIHLAGDTYFWLP